LSTLFGYLKGDRSDLNFERPDWSFLKAKVSGTPDFMSWRTF